MPLDAPHTAPINNLRLPDALTVRHGPAPLLSRFVIEADKAARALGLELRVRYDFEELVHLNREQAGRGNWHRLLNAYNPSYVDIGPDNAFWIAGSDEHGEIVATHALHVYDWTGTNLKEQAQSVFYGREEGAPCQVTADAAEMIGGVVGKGGAAWVRPDWRGKQLSHLMPRMMKAFGSAHWPLDWVIGLVQPPLVRKGVAAGYGSKHISYSIFYPQSAWGDLEVAVVYTAVDEIYRDLAEFLATRLTAAQPADYDFVMPVWASSGALREQSVTNTSPDGVFHGSRTRS
ncbi:MAG TPA: hypothetical protein VME41_12830 [Stellaceae bacterium]|nr:hypothetical protein [Stellaceae bacterium]